MYIKMMLLRQTDSRKGRRGVRTFDLRHLNGVPYHCAMPTDAILTLFKIADPAPTGQYQEYGGRIVP